MSGFQKDLDEQLERLTADFHVASRRLLAAKWDSLHVTVLEWFPEAVQIVTEGNTGEDGACSLDIDTVLDSTGADLLGHLPIDDNVDMPEQFADSVSDDLQWIGVLSADDWLGRHTHDITQPYQLVKLVAVLRLRRSFHPDTDINDVLPITNAYGEVLFAATDPGYDGEFADVGADPSSWTETP